MKAFTDVTNIYMNTHTITNLSADNYQIWAFGEHKRKTMDTININQCKQACCLYHTCLDSLAMTYQVSLYTMQCCQFYMVSQTDNCESYLSSYQLIRPTRVFFVKNLLQKLYRICCVTRQESIHAIANFPTRAMADMYITEQIRIWNTLADDGYSTADASPSGYDERHWRG